MEISLWKSIGEGCMHVCACMLLTLYVSFFINFCCCVMVAHSPLIRLFQSSGCTIQAADQRESKIRSVSLLQQPGEYSKPFNSLRFVKYLLNLATITYTTLIHASSER